MSLRTTLSEAAVEFVRSCHEPPAIDEIIDHLMQEYSDELEAEGKRAQRDFVRSAAKAGLSDKPRDDAQPILPGFDVPSTLSIPLNEGRVVYVSTENASREQAHAHTVMKDANIAHAVEERRKWGELLDLLETVWVNDASLTVGECIQRLQ